MDASKRIVIRRTVDDQWIVFDKGHGSGTIGKYATRRQAYAAREAEIIRLLGERREA